MKFTKDEIRRGMTLYAVTDRTWLGDRTLEQVVEEVLRGGATFLQLREKELTGEALLSLARRVKEVAARYRVPFVVNDSVELALACDADGVHVGQRDLMGRDIRAIIGPDKILGITANTVELAMAAQQAGADYVGAGAVFGTTTKGDAKNLSLDTLRDICRAVTIPVVAIGGINAGNLLRLAGTGAAGAAVVSALFAQAQPEQSARSLRVLAEEMVAAYG
ncbi:thiamine phosphate synthase [Pseudoflavonifractor phocaeensis]|uniref:thiamine phosphate synthase n=1 Tax=Pseudoflavonifractor phocaeensis TaxID=1870988 RepID=UPI001958D8D7|nr:thiamine phosphate synthase [Pseudoflavonifractor phocaeensis]MBM6925383.1 thiamine phosphate synthase [Pseudoflavonifractor phocaeensis]